MSSRRFRKRCLLAVSSVLVLLGLAEGTLRLFPGLLPVQLRRTIRADPRLGTASHPYIGHLNRATSETDPYGFPNDWPWPDTPAIITLGDSVTRGSGVEKAATWTAILARAFPERGVVNLGLSGSGPQQYVRVYETFGVERRARLILVGFFAGNDFWDAAMFDRWLESGAGGNYLAWRDFGRPPSASLNLRQPKRLLARSALWRAELAARSTHLGSLLLYSARRTGAPSGIEVYEAPDGTRLDLQPENLLRNARLAQPGAGVLTRVFASVQRIHSLAHENGASALVIFLPSKEEVYLPLLRVSSPDPAAPLRDALDDRGIPYLDVLEDFRHHAANGEVLFVATDSPLPNARGHALIAELVISHLRQHAKRYGL